MRAELDLANRRLAGPPVPVLLIYDLAAETYSVAAAGGDENQWRMPVWLSDNRRVVYRDGRGIWLVDPGHGEPRRLVTVGGYAIGRSVGVSRDDRWLTWTETGTKGDIWTAELQ